MIDGNSAGIRVAACDPTPGDISLTVSNTAIRGNRSNGVYTLCGRLEVVDSSISANAGSPNVGGSSAGVYAHYAGQSEPASEAESTPDVSIVNTTITGNRTLLLGGGVLVSQTGAVRPGLSIVNSTIAENTSVRVGGVHTVGAVGVSIVNSAVAHNSGSQCSFGLAPTMSEGNASSDESCSFAFESVTAGLAEPADNGGAAPIGPNGGMGNVLTMAIGTSSPLFGSADNSACREEDARGVRRPQGAGCDIGAFEAVAVRIGDRVWEDRDNNGEQDSGERPLSGVTLDLLNTDDQVVGTRTTAADGLYSFDVTPGEWTVRVTDTGKVFTDHQAVGSESVSALVSAGGSGTLVFDFGYAPLLTIGDLVWLDENGDGERDDGESPIAGVALELLNKKGQSAGTTTTDDNGAYSFRVAPGRWTVRVADTGVLASRSLSTPGSGHRGRERRRGQPVGLRLRLSAVGDDRRSCVVGRERRRRAGRRRVRRRRGHPQASRRRRSRAGHDDDRRRRRLLLQGAA